MEGKTILAFVRRGNKFADCSSSGGYTEVTSQVDCKAVANLGSVTLPAPCGGSSEGKTRDGGVLKTGCYSNREKALIMKESQPILKFSQFISVNCIKKNEIKMK